MIARDRNVKSRLKASLVVAVKWMFDYLFIWSLMIVTMYLVKRVYGSHRPYFFSVCQPSTVNCTVGSLVTDYTCENPDLTPKRRKLISESFPSAHACWATYISVFAICYIHSRIPKLKIKFIKPALQGIFLAYMLILGASRIFDNAHHPVDVLFGTLMGAAYSLFNVSRFIHSDNNFKVFTDSSASSCPKVSSKKIKKIRQKLIM